jgi:Fic family protein
MVTPDFDAPLTDLIIELDYLRKKKLDGFTPPQIFHQLKTIFHYLESLGSARIEGNNTTLAEYIETTLEPNKKKTSTIQEISNIEDALNFIENSIHDIPINRALVCEIHKRITHNLPTHEEGDPNPGRYRKINVTINRSAHKPPDSFLVDSYMDELFHFINGQYLEEKYDLLKTVFVHHRFAWIHPFGNGNGRTVRLLTYAMLVKQGFNVGRVINPTAVFCMDRDKYYHYLGLADTGSKEGMLQWAFYVLNGLKTEIEKIDHLNDFSYLKKEILLPTLKIALSAEYITEKEYLILSRSIEHQLLQARHIKDLYTDKAKSEISRQIKLLIDKKMLIPEIPGTRKYVLSFENNYLLRAVIKVLGEKGFLSVQ